MSTQRYFLEVSYYGAAYSGFQVQENANSVQEEVEKAITHSTKKRSYFNRLFPNRYWRSRIAELFSF
jgi:tRNA U38,U39,U40 pseudouridine synthase TruA